MSRHYIVNIKTKKYIEVVDFLFNGEWKEEFPHTKGIDWYAVYAYSIWNHDQTSNGIYFVYDMSANGGHYTLLVDIDKHNKADIEKAKKELRHKKDIVKLHILRLRKDKNP